MPSISEKTDLVDAAKRLEEKYPVIKQRGGLAEFIQQRYAGVVERVPVDRFDPKGSVIGFYLLDPEIHPRVPEIPVPFIIGLAQLDLDQVAAVTGRDVGTGILEVWMPYGFWDQSAELGSLRVRVIPRDVIDQMKDISNDDYILEPSEEELRAQADIDKLLETDPEEAESKLWHHHYDKALWGTDWLLSSYYSDYGELYTDHKGEKLPHGIADGGDPLQIVQWEAAGWDLPPVGCFWATDFDIEEVHPEISEDLDFITVSAAMEEDLPSLSVGLFASDWQDALEVEDHPELGWRKLFHFDGPGSHVFLDRHTVYYRKSDDGFEYTGACIRCRW